MAQNNWMISLKVSSHEAIQGTVGKVSVFYCYFWSRNKSDQF